MSDDRKLRVDYAGSILDESGKMAFLGFGDPKKESNELALRWNAHDQLIEALERVEFLLSRPGVIEAIRGALPSNGSTVALSTVEIVAAAIKAWSGGK